MSNINPSIPTILCPIVIGLADKICLPVEPSLHLLTAIFPDIVSPDKTLLNVFSSLPTSAGTRVNKFL
jgi:hypothetical protein